MNPMLQLARQVSPNWLNVAPARTARLGGEAMVPPALYRSEAFGEDLADLYPELRFDADTHPLPRSRLGLSHMVGRVALALVWGTSLVLATVLVIHGTLA